MKKKYIFRTYSAGVWFGEIKELKGSTATIVNCRKLWKWSGANELSDLSQNGVKNKDNCKFSLTITDEQGVYLPQIIEILPCSEEAIKSINAVKDWVYQ